MENLQQQQLVEALMQAALLESKALSVSIAEIIAYLQQKKHLAALGTFQALENNSSSWAPCSKPQHGCRWSSPARFTTEERRNTAMTDSTLKFVVVLDPETRGYKPAGHNLAASEAVTLAEQFSGENRPAKVLDQEERHRTSDPAKCRACKKAAEATSQTPNPDAETADAARS
jgi:hypothetical protein